MHHWINIIVVLRTALITSLISFSYATCVVGQQVNAGHSESLPKTKVYAGQGIMAGEVSSDSALVQLRLTATDKLVDNDVAGVEGVVEFTLTDQVVPSKTDPVMRTALAENDCIARVRFDGLNPDTLYRCETRIGLNADELSQGPSVLFRTMPGSDSVAPVSFAVVTGMNYARFHGIEQAARKKNAKNEKLPKAYDGPDKHLGFPALRSIQNFRPDFFVGTGDNVYYDRPSRPRAKTVSELRQKWHEQFVQQRFRDLFTIVPTFWMVDDHDYRVDDCDNSGDYKPDPQTAKRVLFEQLPYGPIENKNLKTYRSHRVTKDLQVWFTESRLHRSPNKMPDGPDKSMWGADQKEWLKETLLASDAKYKILISPTPMVGPDDLRKKDNHCNFGGYRHERDEFFKFLMTNGLDNQHFFIVCGDRHWQYHARDPSGFEEFSCGALVDANSRLGRAPGDPNGTDPEGQIHQFYTQNEASGGFLIVSCQRDSVENTPGLTFRFYDEKGDLLYACKR